MKVKELERFACSAWSPASCEPTILATLTAEEESGTSTGGLESCTPVLELFCLRLQDPSTELSPKVTVQVTSRATCLCWGAPSTNSPLGLLISGTAFGGLNLYNPNALLFDTDGSEVLEGTTLNIDDHTAAVLVANRENVHTGAVRSVDANRFQTNLFASVADEAEILIWDVEKMEQPMSPGNKLQPIEPISTAAWNPRVQHILATASAGHCTIWDLRRSDPVVHLTKAMCQFEPHLMAWSPDVATRLCLADPAHPTADIQLWDLRFPKHMLALLARWPPPTSGFLGHAALGNAGTINALAWSPSCMHQQGKPGLSLHESELIAVSLTASGALPTVDGGYGTGLQPTSADFLAVWSVEEALKSVQTDASSVSAMRQPVFVGRLEDSSSEVSPTSTSLSGLPSNASVHWLPTQPGLVSITQSEGWISVINLNAGSDTALQSSGKHLRSSLTNKHTRARHASHKVAEAFGEEVDLNSCSSPTTNRDLDALAEATSEVRLAEASRVGDTVDGEWVHDSLSKRSQSLPLLPQPMPCLRVAPRWLKRPCSANFSFGGRLVWFSNNKDQSKQQVQSSSSPSPTSDVSSAPAPTGANPTVQIQGVETMDDCHPVSGVNQPAGNQSDMLKQMINWLSEAVCRQAADLGSVCEGLGEFCQPRPTLLKDGVTKTNPWQILRTRLQSTETMTSAISSLLGYDVQAVQAHIETALKEPVDGPSDMTCFCSSQTSCNLAISRLDSLKMALVTADFPSAIRLCLHGSFSGLPCPGLSPLSALSVFLATHAGQNDLYAEAQHSVLGALNQLSQLSDAKKTDLHSVTLLLSALLQDDWSVVAQLWPLEDWSTAVAALVNHTWARNRPLFKHLCMTLIDRLLDYSVDCTFPQVDRCTAAWICAVLAGDVNGVIRSWYNLNSVDAKERRGEQLLPLALQLVLVQKYADAQLASEPTAGSGLPSVAQVFSTVAMWLGHVQAGRSDEDIMVALNLLLQFNIGTQEADFSEVNEAAHRLWCGLSDEQRRNSTFKFTTPFVCPYQQSSCFSKVKPCSCRRTPLASAQPHYPQPHFSSYHTVPPSPLGRAEGHTGQQVFGISPIQGSIRPPLANQFSTAPPFSATSSVAAPPIPTYGAPPSFSGHASLGSTPPLLPSAPPLPQSPLPSWSQSPMATNPVTMPPTMPPKPAPPPSVWPNTSTVDVTHAPVTPQQNTCGNTTLPPPPPETTSRAWNDPPWLAKTYQLRFQEVQNHMANMTADGSVAPVRPPVTVNQYYDPSQFTAQLAPNPGPPYSGLNAPPNPQIPAPPLAPFPTSMRSASPSLKPSCNASTLTTPTPPLPPLPPMVSRNSQPYASMFPSPTQSLVPMSQPSIGGPPPGAQSLSSASFLSEMSTHTSPYRTDDHFDRAPGKFRTASPVMPPTTYQSAYPRLGTDQWPAAQPIGVAHAPPPPTSGDSALPDSPLTVLNGGAVEGTLHEQTTPVNPEFAAMEETLTKLIQLCRTVGGKPVSAKMDTVDRRIGSLFASLRGTPGAAPLSEVVLQHLRDCVNSAAQSDYASAVEHANLLIQSASGFESIHSFAPGLKMLMQSARQLFPPNNRPDGAGEQWPIRAF